VKYSEMHLSDPRKMGGYIELAKAKVRWFLSVDCKDLPPEAVKAGRPTYRSITMENKSHLNCFVHEPAYVDDNVKIQNNVSVYEGTTIEDDVFLGPSCVLTNVLNPRSQVRRKALIEVKSRSSMESQTNDVQYGLPIPNTNCIFVGQKLCSNRQIRSGLAGTKKMGELV